MTETVSVAYPWPPRSLAANARSGHWGERQRTVQRVRHEARLLSTVFRAVRLMSDGPIPLLVTFRPPSNRGDRANYPHLAKSILDGVADALGVNDRRFSVTYAYGEPVRGGLILVAMGERARLAADAIQTIAEAAE